MTKVISTRHIRHDWDRWFDNPDQTTVKTMCGVRSRTGLCGIPGITKQPEVVEKSGRRVWGWCMGCVRATWRDSSLVNGQDVDNGLTTQAIVDLYKELRRVISKQYYSYLKAELKRAENTNRNGSARHIGETLLRLVDEFPEVTAPQRS